MVVSILATAALLQLQGLIDNCADVMNQTINAETAVPYHIAAIQYGTKEVKTATFNWLLINLLSFYADNTRWLPLMSADLLTELVQSPDLVVMQTEFALYALLKVWMYLKLHAENHDESSKLQLNESADVIKHSASFFEGLKSEYNSVGFAMD